MAQDGCLGRGRGAAGEQLHGDALALARVHAGIGSSFGSADKTLARVNHVLRARRKALDTLDVADDEGRLDACNQRPQIGIGQTVIEWAIGHPRQRCAKQGDWRRFTAGIQQRHMFGPAGADQVRRTGGGGPQLAVAPVAAAAGQADATGLCARGHVQKKRNIHASAAVSRTPARAWRP